MNIGLNAYHKHSQPSQEMKDIWALKEKLINEIMTKKPELTKEALEFKTPEQLEEILYGHSRKSSQIR